MDYEINVTDNKPVKLSDEDEQHIVKYVVETWDHGVNARKSYETEWEKCEKAYRCEHEPIADVKLDWRSRVYLPWSYEAIESWYAYMHNTMMPRDEDAFTISGRTDDDNDAALVMDKYQKYVFDKNNLVDQFGRILKQAGIRGQTCAKIYWREDLKKYKDQELTDYNGVWFDVIDIKNFVFFPIYGDFDKSTRIQKTYRYLEELEEAVERKQVPYVNLDKLRKDMDDKDEDNYVASSPPSPSTPVSKEDTNSQFYKGVELKEAWIHRARINKKIYRDVVAVIANDKHLIRFQPNPYPMGLSPFVWRCLIPDGLNNMGFGVLSKVLPLQQAANFAINALLDESKIKIYRSYKYYDDGIIDVENMVARPGAFIELADAQSVVSNMLPMQDDFGNIQLGFQNIAEMKLEFEEATVPKVVKGMVNERETTATEITATTNSASGKMHIQAQNLNGLLKDMLELSYALTQERSDIDPRIKEDIARVTQPAVEMVEVDDYGNPLPEPMPTKRPIEDMVASLPAFVPLPLVDIKVVGYQNSIIKQQQLTESKDFMASLAESPAAPYANWQYFPEMFARLLNLPKDKVVLPPQAVQQQQEAQAQQAQQQQQMMEAQMQMEMQTKQMEMQAKQVEIQLKQQQMELEAAQQQQQMELEKQKLELDMLKEEHKHHVDMEKLKLEAMAISVTRETAKMNQESKDKQEKKSNDKN